MNKKNLKYNLIIDFEAVTNPWKVKTKFYMQPLPFIMGMGIIRNNKKTTRIVIFNGEKYTSKRRFLNYIKNQIFAFIKETYEFKKRLSIHEVQFISFGDSLERKILKQIFNTDVHIKDLANTFKEVGLNKIIEKIQGHEHKLLVNKLKNKLFKSKDDTPWTLQDKRFSLGSFASYLGWLYIVLEREHPFKSKDVSKHVNKKELIEAIKEYNLQDIKDLFFLIQNKEKGLLVTNKIIENRKIIRFKKQDLRTLVNFQDFFIKNGINRITSEQIEKYLKKTTKELESFKKLN